MHTNSSTLVSSLSEASNMYKSSMFVTCSRRVVLPRSNLTPVVLTAFRISVKRWRTRFWNSKNTTKYQDLLKTLAKFLIQNNKQCSKQIYICHLLFSDKGNTSLMGVLLSLLQWARWWRWWCPRCHWNSLIDWCRNFIYWLITYRLSSLLSPNITIPNWNLFSQILLLYIVFVSNFYDIS
jgi:hypothetical protein